MPDITELLSEARSGAPEKLGEVFEILYSELRRLAAARARSAAAGAPPVTTTALVHETYLKLVGAQRLEMVDRRHFFACAAKAMRHILTDSVRAQTADKRGGALRPVTLPVDLGSEVPDGPWIDLDRALDELDQISSDQREVVELRFYAGLTRDEVAELLGVSAKTVQRR